MTICNKSTRPLELASVSEEKFLSQVSHESARINPKADLALLFVAITWGSSYLATKDVVTLHTIFAVLTVRYILATVGLALFLARKLRHITRMEVLLGGLFGVILGLIFGLETYGVAQTSASNAGVIISLAIVITPIIDRIFRQANRPQCPQSQRRSNQWGINLG